MSHSARYPPQCVLPHLTFPPPHVQGPKGELQRILPELVTIEQEGNIVKVVRVNETRQANCQHGLSRSLVNSMVVGVSEGFTKTLSLIGVGYRAAATGSNLTLTLGYSHPVEMLVPKGIEVKVEKNTTVIVSGFDKELVGQFAANVRSKREPEPYKGKGVRYVDEYVRRKEGKRGK
jgi:large subunit ribosomal protein L6